MNSSNRQSKITDGLFRLLDRLTNSISSFVHNVIGTDGLMHYSVSITATVLLGLFIPLWISAIVIFAIGIGKEIYDLITGRGHFEWKDLLCDALGCFIGYLYTL